MDDFDFGPIETGSKWFKDSFPMEGRKTLLLDADFIPYTVGFCAKPHDSLQSKLDHACYLIRQAMTKAKADSVILYLTDSANNFRNTLVDDYKAQRSKEKPLFWHEVKEWIASLDCAVMSDHNEADDMISIKMHEFINELKADGVELTEAMFNAWCPYIIGSKDKDLAHIMGPHVNLTTGDIYFVDKLGTLEPKWATKTINDYQMVKVGEYVRGPRKGEPKFKRTLVGTVEKEYIKSLKGTGMSFFLAQMLMGDATDNYFGLEGWGATKTYQYLSQVDTIEEREALVHEAYKNAHGDNWFAHYLTQGRMAWMCQYQGELWDGTL